MSRHPRATSARPAPRTALLLTLPVLLSVLLSTLLPAGAAWARDITPTAADAAGAGCAALPLTSFGDPAGAVGKATVAGRGGSVCFGFTAEKAGLHRVVLGKVHAETYSQVFDGTTQLNCNQTDRSDAGWCDLPRAGAYTLKVVNQGWQNLIDTPVAVVPLNTADHCAPEAGTAWDTPVVKGSAPGPVAIMCRPFTGKAGERITVDLRTDKPSGDSQYWITDASGARICPRSNDDNSEGCVLPGDGPYRVLARIGDVEGGFPAAYTLKIRRLSDPAGCAHVPLNAYGAAPTTVDAASGCKVFTAPAAGSYDVYGVHDGSRSRLKAYDQTGRTVCASDGICTLPAAGDYTVLTDDATLILDRSAVTGCRPVELGTHQGTLTHSGEVDCLTLPLPKGSGMAALKSVSGQIPRIDVTVADATGAEQCDGTTLNWGTCGLNGTAPFRVLVSAADQKTPTGSYRLALYRTSAPNDCQVLPAGDFTSESAHAGLSTGGGVISHCLTIPAGDHSAMESIQLQAAPGTTARTYLSVVDKYSRQVCRGPALQGIRLTCNLVPGVAHTVLVNGSDTTGTYTLTRRDVTSTAKGCTANPATPVGGPSTGGTFSGANTLLCRQVTTSDAEDTLHLDVRDAHGTASLVAYGEDGKLACSTYPNKACAVTGSTHYQVLVTVPTSQKDDDPYHFDALRIATAAGPARECTAVPNISYGYGPITGTLDEQHTAVCAVLPTAVGDRFDMAISDTTGATDAAVPALYDKSLDNGCTLTVPTGYGCSVDEPDTRGASPSIMVLSLPKKASHTSYRAELICSSVICGTQRVSVDRVTPTTAESGTKATVRVTGTALHKDDKVVLSRVGGKVESTTVSVAANRRTLTAVLDLTGALPGDWNLGVITHNAGEYALGTFTVTPPTLTNTAAPAIGGTAQVGATLTANPGSWMPTPVSYGYQWQADGEAISGATASTYTVPASLLGKKLTVAVTARLLGGETAVTSAAVTVDKGAAPMATTAPKISGTAKVGVKLGLTQGIWTPAVTSYGYQWKADGKAIPGATASTYTVPASLLGKKVTVTVTAHRTGHTDGTATTAAATVAKGSTPKATKAPTISGTAKVGRTLKAAPGTWTPTPSSYAYQWYADGRAIKGATGSSLKPASAERGKKITVKVTARRTGHSDGTATSKPTAKVAR
ncbi:hypothetical protein [Streptomyces sp. NBC_01794]|uniref:hypothetical protein n=1 Tax=Streptomyces sp. NBC_01794 TaxID=2975942 RepID=UPI00308990CB|nr:hypothetical protein OIE54_19745 [Streptomyces sp. NBC_01794]